MDEFLNWLKSFGGSSDENSGGGFDFSMFDFTPDSNTEESVFDPTFGGSMPLPPEMPEGSFDISDPAFYPRSEDNPFGYDPGESYNQPLPSVGAKDFLDLLKKGGSQALDYLKNNPGKVGLMAALTALGAMDKRAERLLKKESTEAGETVKDRCLCYFLPFSLLVAIVVYNLAAQGSSIFLLICRSWVQILLGIFLLCLLSSSLKWVPDLSATIKIFLGKMNA